MTRKDPFIGQDRSETYGRARSPYEIGGPVEGVLTILLPLGPEGPPAKVRSPSAYRAAIALLLGKKETPRPPLIEERRRLLPSVRALASLVADELRGRLADGRLSGPEALIPVT